MPPVEMSAPESVRSPRNAEIDAIMALDPEAMRTKLRELLYARQDAAMGKDVLAEVVEQRNALLAEREDLQWVLSDMKRAALYVHMTAPRKTMERRRVTPFLCAAESLHEKGSVDKFMWAEGAAETFRQTEVPRLTRIAAKAKKHASRWVADMDAFFGK